MLKHVPEWRLLAYQRGQGKIAKLFSGYFPEDGVILLLPLVRVRFAVEPAQWIQWSFVAAPLNGRGANRMLVFQIDPAGRPIRTQ